MSLQFGSHIHWSTYQIIKPRTCILFQSFYTAMSSTDCVMDINSRILSLNGSYCNQISWVSGYPLSAILFSWCVFVEVSPQDFGIDQPRQVASRPDVPHGESGHGNVQREHRRPRVTRRCVNVLRTMYSLYSYIYLYIFVYHNTKYTSISRRIEQMNLDMF